MTEEERDALKVSNTPLADFLLNAYFMQQMRQKEVEALHAQKKMDAQ